MSYRCNLCHTLAVGQGANVHLYSTYTACYCCGQLSTCWNCECDGDWETAQSAMLDSILPAKPDIDISNATPLIPFDLSHEMEMALITLSDVIRGFDIMQLMLYPKPELDTVEGRVSFLNTMIDNIKTAVSKYNGINKENQTLYKKLNEQNKMITAVGQFVQYAQEMATE